MASSALVLQLEREIKVARRYGVPGDCGPTWPVRGRVNGQLGLLSFRAVTAPGFFPLLADWLIYDATLKFQPDTEA
jgi:hypothetical protein